MHVAIGITVPGFLALTWWQFERATHGNPLSWFYTFEWPAFAGYAIYMWWDLLHDPRYNGTESGSGSGTGNGEAGNGAEASAQNPEPRPAFDDEGDEELAAYNKYLSELSQSGKKKTWRG